MPKEPTEEPTEELTNLLAKHGANDYVTTKQGMTVVRDDSQNLWHYYEWTEWGYKETGTTVKHPNFYR